MPDTALQSSDWEVRSHSSCTLVLKLLLQPLPKSYSGIQHHNRV